MPLQLFRPEESVSLIFVTVPQHFIQWIFQLQPTPHAIHLRENVICHAQLIISEFLDKCLCYMPTGKTKHFSYSNVSLNGKESL